MFKSHWKIINENGYYVLYRRKWWQLKYRLGLKFVTSDSACNALFNILRKEGKLK